MNLRPNPVPSWKIIFWTVTVGLLLGATAVAAYVGTVILTVVLGGFVAIALLGHLLFGGKGKTLRLPDSEGARRLR